MGRAKRRKQLDYGKKPEKLKPFSDLERLFCTWSGSGIALRSVEIENLTDRDLEVPVAKFPLFGTKDRIAQYLANLETMHCAWESDGLYVESDVPEYFTYRLTNLRYVKPKIFCKGELRPRSWCGLLRLCGMDVYDRNTIIYLDE